MFFKNNRGISLIGVTVALGIMGGISVAVMRMSKQSSQSVAKLKLNTDVVFSINEINAILSDPVKCKLTFDSDTPDSIVSRVAFDGTNYTVASRKYYKTFSTEGDGASGYGVSKFKINSYQLEGEGSDAFLTLNIEKKASVHKTGGSTTFPRRLNMYVERDGGAITMCRTLTDSYPDVWGRKNDSADIFYTDGNVGIGTNAPTVALEIIGDMKSTGKMTADQFHYTSDKRLKKNIVPLNNSLETILSLRGVTFDWRSSGQHDIGFIAQEVQEQIPEVVGHDSSRDIFTLDYAKVVPFLVEAIKRQQVEIKTLQNKLNNLQ
ncbi:MAG: tail fiber domain-containing protein [Candidatus Marinimicrobia bacterium]|nr:tail fiber domain-containing protein [Candidatus Neomarinimicrobiota bacterium]